MYINKEVVKGWSLEGRHILLEALVMYANYHLGRLFSFDIQ